MNFSEEHKRAHSGGDSIFNKQKKDARPSHYCLLQFLLKFSENLVFSRETSVGDFGFDVLSGLERLFPSDDLGQTLKIFLNFIRKFFS